MQLRAAGMVATLALVLIAFVLAGPTGAAKPAPPHALTATVTNYTSSNWAGYVALAANGKVTRSAGVWTQPAVTCGTTTTYAAFWIGIDGANSGTVEQTGTLAVCSGGKASYSAWWELYPLNSIQTISTVPVHAGDKITASVTFASSKFTMKIVDGTHSFSKSGTQSGTNRSSAECVAERPAYVSGGVVTLTHLANFGTATFSSCTATISGTNAAIGNFSSVGHVNMVSTRAGHATLAATGALATNHSTFRIVWKRAY